MELDDLELLRYSRQILLPEVDIEGQLALKQAKVAIVGLGGLGSPVALYLASSGVGHLSLVDYDEVDLSNLQRQIAHCSDNVGLAKVESAKKTCQSLNERVQIVTETRRLGDNEWLALADAHDILVDCTDNFSTRHALNAACYKTKTPLVSGAAIGFQGQVSVFIYREDSPCYACLYSNLLDEDQPTCAESGVIAPLVGIIGSLQAIEVCKLIVGCGKTLSGRLLLLDGLTMELRTIGLSKDPACHVCSL